jgi:D-alanine-D-alanine ligase-like ATP-grasp enzyme
VQYKKKRHEYRVHFFKVGQNKFEIIDVTQKKKRKGFENVDTKIRNHKNGWVYAREDINEPQDLRTQALNAAFASDLDFGAVDLIWNEHENKCYVLEVNTAPGLTGTTLSAYVNAFVKDITK